VVPASGQAVDRPSPRHPDIAILEIRRARCYPSCFGAFHNWCNGNVQMPIGQVSIRPRRRPGITFVAASLCAGLAGCSDPGIVTRQVNLQQAPTSESAVLASIPRGRAVKVEKCTNGWCYVSWNGRSGYILAKDVSIGVPTRRSTDADRQGAPGEAGNDDTSDDGNLSVPDSPNIGPM
jgi:hypothetical protein